MQEKETSGILSGPKPWNRPTALFGGLPFPDASSDHPSLGGGVDSASWHGGKLGNPRWPRQPIPLGNRLRN
jgi:hypothetical protein